MKISTANIIKGILIAEKSPVHRLDARSKLIFILAVLTTSIVLKQISLLLILALLILFLMQSAKILKKCWILLVLFSGVSVLVCFLIFAYTKDVNISLQAAKTFIRMFSVTKAGLILAFTTSPNNLSKSLEKMKLPRAIIFVVTITMRFFPVLLKEIRQIMDSIKLRGLQLTRIYFKKPRFIFIPLTIRMIRLSDELSATAESRGFGSFSKRTSLKEVKFGRSDYLFLLTVVVFSFTLLILDKGEIL